MQREIFGRFVGVDPAEPCSAAPARYSPYATCVLVVIHVASAPFMVAELFAALSILQKRSENPLKRFCLPRVMLSVGDAALKSMLLSCYTPEELAVLATRDGWGHLGLSRGSEHPHLFVTINLSREKPPEALFEQVQTLTPRIVTFSGALATLEFTPHPHVHILCDRPAKFKASNLIRSLVRSLGLPRPECVDIVSSKKSSDYANRVSYLHGSKVDPLKMDRVSKDVEIRDAANIPHFFSL